MTKPTPWRPLPAPARAAVFVAVFALLAAYLWTLRARHLIDWDAVNYAFALHRYDVTADQPHMPGFFLYIQAGRLVRRLVADDNTALIALSFAFTAGTCALIGRLARERFGEGWGVRGALVAATSPILLFQGLVASSRAAEGFFAALILWLAWRTRTRPDSGAPLFLALAVSGAAGVRQQSLLFVLPLVIWACQHVRPARLAVAVGVAAATTALWIFPQLEAVGGPAVYAARARLHWNAFVVEDTGVFYAPTVAEGLRRLLWNIARIVLYLLGVVGPLALALPFALLRRRPSDPFRTACLLAAVPALAFFALFHIQQAGHVLTVAPVLLLAAMAGLRRSRLPESLPVVGLGLFLIGPSRGLGDQLPPTVAALRLNDAFVERETRRVRDAGPDALVLATDASARLLEYYLPEVPIVTVLQQRVGVRFVRAHGGPPGWLVGPDDLAVAAPPATDTVLLSGRDTVVAVGPGPVALHSRWNGAQWNLHLPTDAPLDPRRLSIAIPHPRFVRTVDGLRVESVR